MNPIRLTPRDQGAPATRTPGTVELDAKTLGLYIAVAAAARRFADEYTGTHLKNRGTDPYGLCDAVRNLDRITGRARA